MSIQSTLDTTVDITIGGEPVSLAVMVNYTFDAGLEHIDPQRSIIDELVIDSVKAEFADGMWSEVDREYIPALISLIETELNTHTQQQWQLYLDDVEENKARERFESLQHVSGF